jgi:hypothetical protein
VLELAGLEQARFDWVLWPAWTSDSLLIMGVLLRPERGGGSGRFASALTRRDP